MIVFNDNLKCFIVLSQIKQLTSSTTTHYIQSLIRRFHAKRLTNENIWSNQTNKKGKVLWPVPVSLEQDMYRGYFVNKW